MTTTFRYTCAEMPIVIESTDFEEFTAAVEAHQSRLIPPEPLNIRIERDPTDDLNKHDHLADSLASLAYAFSNGPIKVSPTETPFNSRKLGPSDAEQRAVNEVHKKLATESERMVYKELKNVGGTSDSIVDNNIHETYRLCAEQAKRLALSLRDKHYPNANQMRVTDDLMLTLTQIDNMCAGLVRVVDQPGQAESQAIEPLADAFYESEVATMQSSLKYFQDRVVQLEQQLKSLHEYAYNWSKVLDLMRKHEWRESDQGPALQVLEQWLDKFVETTNLANQLHLKVEAQCNTVRYYQNENKNLTSQRDALSTELKAQKKKYRELCQREGKVVQKLINVRTELNAYKQQNALNNEMAQRYSQGSNQYNVVKNSPM